MLNPISEIPNASVVIGRARSKIRLIGNKKMRIATTPNVLKSIPLVWVPKPSDSTFSGNTRASTPCENMRKNAPAKARTIPGLRNKIFDSEALLLVLMTAVFVTRVKERRTKNARIAIISMIPPLTAIMKGVLVFEATNSPVCRSSDCSESNKCTGNCDVSSAF